MGGGFALGERERERQSPGKREGKADLAVFALPDKIGFAAGVGHVVVFLGGGSRGQWRSIYAERGSLVCG